VVIGWVLMGFPVSQPLADEMRQLLVGACGAAWCKARMASDHVPVSTLPATRA
jgi:hypothetical protein